MQFVCLYESRLHELYRAEFLKYERGPGGRRRCGGGGGGGEDADAGVDISEPMRATHL